MTELKTKFSPGATLPDRRGLVNRIVPRRVNDADAAGRSFPGAPAVQGIAEAIAATIGFLPSGCAERTEMRLLVCAAACVAMAAGGAFAHDAGTKLPEPKVKGQPVHHCADI